jgi:hypothetical protein
LFIAAGIATSIVLQRVVRLSSHSRVSWEESRNAETSNRNAVVAKTIDLRD